MTSKQTFATVEPKLAIGLHNWSIDEPDSWQFLLDRAVAADRAGIDQLVVSDHVVFGENLDAYAKSELGGRDGGRQPTGSDGHWLEPLTLLSMIAAQTTAIRLSTGVLLAALRRPVVLAKTVTTLDVLSGGRLDLGVGIGWQREEYDAAGLPFAKRGKLLDHTLSVCEALWTNSPASYQSEELQFEKIHCKPGPLQPGGIPVWVSGTINERVLQRVVRFGSGWIPWGDFTENPVPGIEPIHRALRDAGRDVDGFKIRGMLPVRADDKGRIDLAKSVAPAPRLIDAGVTHLQLNLPLANEYHTVFEQLSEAVDVFDKATGRANSRAAVGVAAND
jgi:probable F420-dependent oxidoreductase